MSKTNIQQLTKLPLIRKYFLSGKYPHQYYIISLSDNPEVRDFLFFNGYWDFQPSASTHLISLHCLIAFTYLPHPYHGVKLEVHHIDGNTLNNHPSNLIYLSSEDHRIVTGFQKKLSKLNLKKFYNDKSKAKTKYNRQGRTILNWAEFILSIIVDTIKNTSSWLGNLSVNLYSVVKYIKKYFPITRKVHLLFLDTPQQRNSTHCSP